MSYERPKILVTGANGGLGSAIVAELLKLVPAGEIAISVRDPDAAEKFVAKGVRVRRGDFDDSASLDIAFEGAESVIIVSTRNLDNHARFIQQKNAVDAARRAGAKRIGYTSVIQRPGSAFDLAEGHHRTEDYLRACSSAGTIFCNGHYIENLPMFLAGSIASGILALPQDGPTAWVARQDLAEGIARVMLGDDGKGETLAFTGPEALDFTEIAEIASDILGRSITRRLIDPEAYINGMVSRGVPAAAAASLASGFESRAEGELAEIDPTLGNVLMRPLQTVRQLLPKLIAAPANA